MFDRTKMGPSENTGTSITPEYTAQAPFRHRLVLRLERLLRNRDVKHISKFFTDRFTDSRHQVFHVGNWIVIDWQCPLSSQKIEAVSLELDYDQQTSSQSFVREVIFDGFEVASFI
jgi:hypothetical protein